MASSETHKITNVPGFFYMAPGFNDFDGGESITRAIGRGGPASNSLRPAPYKQKVHEYRVVNMAVIQGDGGGSLHRPYRLRTRHLDWTRAKESQRQRTLTLLDFSFSRLAPYHSNLGVRSG